MKIKNRSRKRRHKRDGIGVRRIRTFSFLPTPLTTPSLAFRLWSSENQIIIVGSRSGRINQSQCTFPRFVIGVVLPLLLPTPTIWFSLNHKRNVSDGVVSGIGTLLDHKLFKILITTPTQTPSLVKTNLEMTRVVYHFQGQSGRFTVWANCKQNSGLLILSRNRLSHLYKSVPFTEKTDAKTWKRNHLEHSARKNRITFWGIPLLPQIFRWDDPESRVPFTFQPDFPTKITPKALPFAACTKTRKNFGTVSHNTWKQHRNNSENLTTGG